MAKPQNIPKANTDSSWLRVISMYRLPLVAIDTNHLAGFFVNVGGTVGADDFKAGIAFFVNLLALNGRDQLRFLSAFAFHVIIIANRLGSVKAFLRAY